MPPRRSHQQHHGERSVQKKMNTPEELSLAVPSFIQTNMPQQHAEFYQDLSYLPLCTLDGAGRPWASILLTDSEQDHSIGVNVINSGQLDVRAKMSPNDPFYRALSETKDKNVSSNLFAGLGVDFSNRRRNKLAGNIASIELADNGQTHLRLNSDEHLGNCPKYITVRELEAHQRQAQVVFDHFDSFNIALPEEAKALINAASTVFLATIHIPDPNEDQNDRADMGLNHRGGAPGFIRVYEEITKPENDKVQPQVDSYLVLPDFSGNRFYQSLGNIESSQLVGLVIPNFSNGDMLYISGKAENLFDTEAQALMPRVKLLSRIHIQAAVMVRGALNLQLISKETYSPYNPPIRYLHCELDAMEHTENKRLPEGVQRSAKLVDIKRISEEISTFRFALNESVDLALPGCFGVFDFSQLLDTGYHHMNDSRPQALNEDYLRTWTISSAAEFDIDTKRFKPVNEIEITVKHKKTGLVSNYLHTNWQSLRHQDETKIAFNGIGGYFSCFDLSQNQSLPRIPEKMLWLAGGVGITPFMAMWDALVNINSARADQSITVFSDIVLVFVGRENDMPILRHFLTSHGTLLGSISLKVIAYQSDADKHEIPQVDKLDIEFFDAGLASHKGRLNIESLREIDDLIDREVYLCGPESLMNSASKWLNSVSAGRQIVHQESYLF